MSTTKIFHAAGLDAGSAWTRCVVFELDGDRLRFRGYGEAPSQGWTKGRIADLNAVSACMESALRAAEEDAGVSLESVVVGVGGNVRGANVRGLRDLGRLRAVEQKDINRAIERALHVKLPEDRMILQVFPQDFLVDGHPGHRDPRKMVAGQIEANVHLATTITREHEILIAAVNQAHVAVEETVFEAQAACYAAVKPDERSEGFAVLNIGAQSLELVVYYGEAVHLACSLPVSADHFTRDVAKGLKLSLEDAASLKHEFGSARAGSTPANSWVEASVREDREVPRRTLNQILEARAEELFELVRRELAHVGMEGALIGGLFLAGGGSRLDGMCDVAEETLRCRARIALPADIQDWPEEIFDPAWTTAAGLAMYSAKLKSQQELQKQSAGIFGRF